MSVRNFVPEIWSAQLLLALRKDLVYGGPGIVNRDYEGEINEAGDTVRITSVSRPTIGTYVPNVTTITPEKLTTAQRTLVVDQSKFWAFEVDDVDARQAKGALLPTAVSEAGFGVADQVDQYLANLYTQAQASNFVNLSNAPIDTYTTPTDAYDKVLVPLRTKLTKANVPKQGRYVVVTPEFTASLLLDQRFINAEKAADAGATLRNGMVGRAAGFDILESNNAPNPSGDTQVVTAGTSAAISFAEQINKTEAYRPENSFADAMKGLVVYGAKVIRPDCLAVAFINPAA